MDKDLHRFQNDEHAREAVKAFLLEQLDKVALERVYEKKDTKDIADAKEVVERAFIELYELYGKEKKAEVNSVR